MNGNHPKSILSGVITLGCTDFVAETIDCCPNCHRVDSFLITLRPNQVDRNITDWSLPIEARVCCRVYDIARNRANSWWLEECKKRGSGRMEGFNENKTVKQVYQPKQSYKPAKTAREEDEEGGLSAWRNRR